MKIGLNNYFDIQSLKWVDSQPSCRASVACRSAFHYAPICLSPCSKRVPFQDATSYHLHIAHLVRGNLRNGKCGLDLCPNAPPVLAPAVELACSSGIRASLSVTKHLLYGIHISIEACRDAFKQINLSHKTARCSIQGEHATEPVFPPNIPRHSTSRQRTPLRYPQICTALAG